MVKKSALLLSVVIALAVGLAIYAAIKVKDEKSRSVLMVRTQSAIYDYQSGIKSDIDFSTVTQFSWERLYIFGPYSVCKHINEIIGVNWLDCKSTGIEYNENGSLFVFVENQRVIQYMIYEGIFTNAVKTQGFSFQEAHFIIDDKGKIKWVYGE